MSLDSIVAPQMKIHVSSATIIKFTSIILLLYVAKDSVLHESQTLSIKSCAKHYKV